MQSCAMAALGLRAIAYTCTLTTLPVWSHDGLICTGETYKSVVKLTFAKGASLKDPSGLFNSSLEGNARRAIDLHEGDEVDGDAFQDAHTCCCGPEQVFSPIIECGSSRFDAYSNL